MLWLVRTAYFNYCNINGLGVRNYRGHFALSENRDGFHCALFDGVAGVLRLRVG